jgi:UDP-N-acetylmuramyl pentapeptide synthase
MRTEWIDAGAVTVLHDGYNANPDSFLAGVGVLTDCKARRRVVIGGDMRELGSRAGELHEKIGQALGAGKVDVVIGVGELGGRIAEAAAPFGKATETFATVADAAAGIGVLLKKGDVVLLKGSRGMGMEALLPALRAAGEKLAGRKSK